MRIDPKKYDMERAKAGVGNVEMARAVDMSLGWVSSINTKIRRNYDFLPKTVSQIAAAIGCEVEDLITDEAGRNAA